MGLEYYGNYNFVLSEEKKKKVLGIIRSEIGERNIEISGEKNDSLFMRFKSYEHRTNWPEDFLIRLEDKQCYICFHNATRDERDKVLNLITEYFKPADITINWEEI